MPYSITTKDGITLQNIPDEIGADAPELKERVAKIRAQMNPAAAADQQTLASAPMRLAKGLKDPVDGAAQLASRLPGAGAVNTAADAVGGFLNRNVFNTSPFKRLIGAPNSEDGDFAGEVLGIRGATPEQLTNDVRAADEQYAAARMATAKPDAAGERDPGFDLARLAGNVLSPVSLTVGKFIPGAKIGAPVRTIAAKGAIGGAAGAATQPVSGEDFWTDKAAQVATGAAAGAVLAPVLSKAGESAARLVERWRGPKTVNVTPERLREMMAAQLKADGIEVADIPEQVFAGLQDDVRSALATGKKLDPAAALRQREFQALGLPATAGQTGRNPAQWTREYNLSGVEGVGEPLQQVFQQQSRGIANRLQRGAAGASERFDAGQALGDELRAANSVSEGNVRAAYDAFRQSTGKSLDVPLTGLAQDYARTLETFGDAVPSAVRKHFDSLGLMGGTQRKVFSIDDAEKLLKVINANYDPSNKVAARALNDLRQGVQRAVVDSADTSAVGAEAAHLASEARGMAAQRFKAIESTPALKAAINNAEPDEFVRKFVIGGKVNEIEQMKALLGPQGRQQVRAQMMAYLEQKAFGANAAGDGKAAQATFNNELKKIGRPKLVALLGEDGAEEMLRVGRVLAYIKQVPEGAAPNTSGTGQMLTSIMGKTRGLKGLPYVNDFVVQPLERFGQRREVAQALAGAPTTPAELDPKVIKALASLFAPAAPAAGVAAGYAIR